MSTGATSSNGREGDGRPGRDLRDRPLVRIGMLVAVLLVAFFVTKSCERQQNEITQDEAVAIAKEHVDFTPDDYQVRYLPQGVPPVYFWAVSLYTLRNGQPAHVQVVLVNATTGMVQDT